MSQDRVIVKYMDPDQLEQHIESEQSCHLLAQPTTKESNTIILDAYNANPTSMDLAIKSFEKLKHTNKVIIAIMTFLFLYTSYTL